MAGAAEGRAGPVAGLTGRLPATESRPLAAARLLVIGILLALMFSPPVANLLQVALVALVLACGELRSHLLRALRQPMVAAALALYLVTCIGVLYSLGSGAEARAMWAGWRKILLLPLAAALFFTPEAKLRLAYSFIAVATLCAIASFVGAGTGYVFPVPEKVPGIVVRNHATQGMLLAVAAFSAIVLCVFRRGLELRHRLVLVACALLLVGSVAVVTSGRSGYLVLLALAASLAVGAAARTRHPVRNSVVLGAGLLALTAALLASSPLARQRIDQAVQEMQSYTRSAELTSMGVRMFFWKNTLTMIERDPWFGTGTGGFEAGYRALVAGRPGVAGTVTSDPHNQYLKIAAEHGLVGMAVFLAFLLSAFVQRTTLMFRVMGLGVLLAWCATSLANSHFSTFAEGSFIYLWLGAMLARDDQAAAAPA